MRFTLNQEDLSTTKPGLRGWLTENSLAGMARRKALLGYIFLVPTLIGLCIFSIGPVLFSFGLSLFNWNIIDPPEFIGGANYERLVNDPVVLKSFSNTGVFVLMAVSLQLTISLLMALIIQQKRMSKWLRYIFRSIFFLPLLTSGATISIVMSYMFQKELGPINYYLSQIGLPQIPWLNSTQWSLITIVLTYLWQQLGFTFLIFLGGLGGISPEIQDAADVDGARGLFRLWNITLPLLSPTILFAAVVSVIGALQVFAEPFVMTKGGPGDSSRTAVLLLYQASFQNLELGFGSAIAVVLFVVIMTITAVQFWLSKHWVFYQ